MKKDLKNCLLGVLQKTADGVLAGILISLGGAVYLACYDPDTPYSKYIGAFLFPLALLCICWRGYALYTGKIGLIYEKHTKEDVSVLLLSLLGNLIGTVAFGYLIAFTLPHLKETALTLCSEEGGKLGQGYGFGLLRAVLCGLLVYLSIDVWRNNHTPLGILLCIPAFILSGYEHSIADMFYFACSGIASWEAFLYLMLIVLGNSIGALIIPTLKLIRPRNPAEKTLTKDEHTMSATDAQKDES